MRFKRGKTRNLTVKRERIWLKMIEHPEKALIETFSFSSYCKYAGITICHAMFCPKDLLGSVFVRLKIGVDRIHCLWFANGKSSIKLSASPYQTTVRVKCFQVLLLLASIEEASFVSFSPTNQATWIPRLSFLADQAKSSFGADGANFPRLMSRCW